MSDGALTQPESVTDSPEAESRRARWIFRLGDCVYFAILIGLIGYAYAPSYDHAHRADQWSYFVDTMDCDGFVETFAATYSYNRTRNATSGDKALFRPVLFAMLAAERAWFGYEPSGWHLVGMILHVVVVILLFRLLKSLGRAAAQGRGDQSQRDWSFAVFRATPYVLTAFFALNYAIVEQVIWSHINGYLLFFALLLGATVLLFGIGDGKSNRLRMAAAWGMTLIAAFTYESGQVIAVVFAAYVLFGRKGAAPRYAATAFLGITLLYQGLNIIDRRTHTFVSTKMSQSTSVLRTALTHHTIRNYYEFGRYAGLQPFESVAAQMSVDHRLTIKRPDYSKSPPDTVVITVWLLSALCLLAAAGSSLFALRSEGWTSERFLRPTVVVGLLWVQASVIVMGRMNLRGAAALDGNSYYTYSILCLLMLSVGIGCFAIASMRIRKPMSVAVGGMFVLLLTTSGRHVEIVRRTNDQYSEWSRAQVQRTRELLAFLEAHRHEPGFSVAFDRHLSQRTDETHGVPHLALVARHWENAENPKYVIVVKDGRLRMLQQDEYRKQFGSEAASRFSRLVRVGSSYNIFQYGDRYYGVLHWDGVYDPRRASFHYLVEGSSPEAVLRLKDEAIQRQAADTAAGRFAAPDGAPRIALEGYRGYNVLEINKHFYAVPQHCGGFFLRDYFDGRYQGGVDGSDVATVTRRIDRLAEAIEKIRRETPHLVEQNYRGYNIIRVDRHFYAIRGTDGEFRLDRYRRGEFPASCDASTVPALKSRIDQLSQVDTSERTRT